MSKAGLFVRVLMAVSALVYDILPPGGKVSESEACGVWQSIANDAMFMVF